MLACDILKGMGAAVHRAHASWPCVCSTGPSTIRPRQACRQHQAEEALPNTSMQQFVPTFLEANPAKRFTKRGTKAEPTNDGPTDPPCVIIDREVWQTMSAKLVRT